MADKVSKKYLVLIYPPEPDETYYAVEVPALQGCHSQGATLAEALENAKEAITLYLEVLADEGKTFPEDRIIPIPIEVEMEIQAKARL